MRCIPATVTAVKVNQYYQETMGRYPSVHFLHTLIVCGAAGGLDPFIWRENLTAWTLIYETPDTGQTQVPGGGK